MKVTKEYLKRVIKEELGRMEEMDVPFSDPGSRPGDASYNHEKPNDPYRAGPEAFGDEIRNALRDAEYALRSVKAELSVEIRKRGLSNPVEKGYKAVTDMLESMTDRRFPLAK